MLQTMRDNAQGIVAKVIVFFIIVVFALWGVESIVNLGGGEEAVAEVGNVEISELDIQRTVEQQKSNLRRQFGEQFDENLFNDQLLRQSAIEQLIQESAELVHAGEMGMYASSRAIDEAIVGIPAFQLDGRFNKEQFLSVLRLNGWTPVSFRQNMAEDIKSTQARLGFSMTAIPTDFQNRMVSMLMAEQRQYSWKLFNTAEMMSEVEVTDEDIQSYYDANQQRFKTPELVTVRYTGLSREAFEQNVEVADEEIEQAYQDYIDQLAEREQRGASHVLVEVNDDRDEQAAAELAQQVYERAAAGEDFAALAGEFSDDIGTSSSGGDLGVAPRGSYDESFEAALYALSEGEVSTPVKTEYGYHVIKLTSVLAPERESLEQKRDELVGWIRGEKAQMLLAEQVQELSNLAFSSNSIDEVASAFGLEVSESEPFTRAQGEGFAANGNVRDMAFQDNMLFDREMSEVVENDEGAWVFVVSRHEEPSVMPLEQVRDRVMATLRRDGAEAAARAQAEALVESEDVGEGWEQESATFVQRGTAPRQVQVEAFALAQGQRALTEVPGGFAVVVVNQIERPELADVVSTADVAEQMDVRESRGSLLSYRKWVLENTEIKRPGA